MLPHLEGKLPRDSAQGELLPVAPGGKGPGDRLRPQALGGKAAELQLAGGGGTAQLLGGNVLQGGGAETASTRSRWAPQALASGQLPTRC